jgi:butyrate kinase
MIKMSNEGILVINPGSTSTKVAFFQGESLLLEASLRHSQEDISRYARIMDQYHFRLQVILEFIEQKKIKLTSIAAVVGRGGVLKPLPGGTYLITDEMVAELKGPNRAEHASNLGALLAKEIAEMAAVPAFIVDPVVVDELEPIARISGMAGIERISIFHALNQKAVARKTAAQLGTTYDAVNLIVAHLGGGISVGVHQQGRVIDVNNALDGEGPFSPERSGGVPVGQLIELCFNGSMTKETVYRQVVGAGGLVGYLGTNDAREVEKRIKNGDQKAKLVYEAMLYQVAKEIGAAATVLKGQVDAIVLTGGLVYSSLVTDWLIERIGFLAPVFTFPGEGEMEALAYGALRVLRGEEVSKSYPIQIK